MYDIQREIRERRTIGKELRAFSCVTPLEVRAGETGKRTLVGHATVFNQLSEVIGRWSPFREKIQPGAFTKSLKTRDVLALYQHLSWAPIARASVGSLLVREDGVGLACEITPIDTTWGRDTITVVESRVVQQMSIGMQVVSDYWQTVEKEEIRTIVEAELFEVSPVTWAAYTQTDINARDIAGVDARELRAAFESCRDGSATADDLELVRMVARELASAAGSTPDEIKRKLEYHRRRLDLLAAA